MYLEEAAADDFFLLNTKGENIRHMIHFLVFLCELRRAGKWETRAECL